MADEPVGLPANAEELFDPDIKKPEEFLDIPPKNSDPVAQREKALSDKQKAIHDGNDLAAILAMPEGRRFLARLIGEPCGWNLPHFHPEPTVMAEVAGRRSIAYQLEQWICEVSLERWFDVRRELERRRKGTKEPKKPKVQIETRRTPAGDA